MKIKKLKKLADDLANHLSIVLGCNVVGGWARDDNYGAYLIAYISDRAPKDKIPDKWHGLYVVIDRLDNGKSQDDYDDFLDHYWT